MIRLIASFMLAFAVPAHAQDHDLRTYDRVLDGAEISATFVGKTADFGSGQLRFLSADRLEYIYPDGKPLTGGYSVESSGKLCITYDNGTNQRCHFFVIAPPKQLVMVTDWQQRFPITLK